jgi:hypothetical protein
MGIVFLLINHWHSPKRITVRGQLLGAGLTHIDVQVVTYGVTCLTHVDAHYNRI